jgi:hypothetical protein
MLAAQINAISDSPERMLWQARCTASNDVAQAASRAMLGPRRSKKYDSRPAAAALEPAPTAA